MKYPSLVPLASLMNCRGRLVSLEYPVVMGILNMTPDSFSDGGLYYNDLNAAMHHVQSMIAEGASIIDIGGCSTRPGSTPPSVDEEIQRIYSVTERILADFPDVLISIDTYRAEVARQMLELGAHIINDVTAGLHDPRMLETVAQYAVPYIAMHIKGMPDTMQHDPVYNNVVDDVWDYFVDRVNAATDAGITDIILDPGFGFGKTLKHNYTLLNNLEKFTLLGLPIAIGISRKSMISGLLHANRDELLPAVSALHLKALEMGVKILRVHDVRAARQVVRLYRFLLDGHQ